MIRKNDEVKTKERRKERVRVTRKCQSEAFQKHRKKARKYMLLCISFGEDDSRGRGRRSQSRQTHHRFLHSGKNIGSELALYVDSLHSQFAILKLTGDLGREGNALASMSSF